MKRTKSIKLQTQPPIQLDVKPPLQLDEFHNIQIKQEQAQSEPSSIPLIKEEVLQDLTPPSLPSPPPSISICSPSTMAPISNFIEEESIQTNLNAIKLEPCIPNTTNLIHIEDKIVQDNYLNVEPISLTADEIRKAEEGQAAAAMLLEQMSDIEQKYNPPLTPSPPPPPPSPSPPPLILSSLSENVIDSKFSPSTYIIKREFHPEDMLTSTTQSINTEYIIYLIII